MEEGFSGEAKAALLTWGEIDWDRASEQAYIGICSLI